VRAIRSIDAGINPKSNPLCVGSIFSMSVDPVSCRCRRLLAVVRPSWLTRSRARSRSRSRSPTEAAPPRGSRRPRRGRWVPQPLPLSAQRCSLVGGGRADPAAGATGERRLAGCRYHRARLAGGRIGRVPARGLARRGAAQRRLRAVGGAGGLPPPPQQPQPSPCPLTEQRRDAGSSRCCVRRVPLRLLRPRLEQETNRTS